MTENSDHCIVRTKLVLWLTCLLGVIRLDAADVWRLLGHQDLHQLRQAGFELSGCLEGTADGSGMDWDEDATQRPRREGEQRNPVGDDQCRSVSGKHWSQCQNGGRGLLACDSPPASAPVCEALFSKGAENPHHTAHSGLERGDTRLFVVLWESILHAWIYECVESAENKDGLKNGAESLTVSGRFLSLSSSLSKHWVRILFSDMHMTCKHTQISPAELHKTTMCGETGSFLCWNSHFTQAPSHLLQVPEQQVVVLVKKPWRRREEDQCMRQAFLQALVLV